MVVLIRAARKTTAQCNITELGKVNLTLLPHPSFTRSLYTQKRSVSELEECLRPTSRFEESSHENENQIALLVT